MDRPNPIEPLAALVERTLTVAHIGANRLWTVEPGTPTSDAAAALAARDFDIAGVKASPVTEYVRRGDLERSPIPTVDELARPIPASMCVEKSLPLGQLLQKLRDSEFVFVLDGDAVTSVVTRADLQAAAIGVVVLAFLTLMESGLRRLVMAAVGDSFLDLLSPDRQSKAEQILQDKVRQNVATGYEDCLFFNDWLQLAKCSGVWRHLDFTSRSQFEKFTSSFVTIRNNLAHGGTILDDRMDPTDALDRVDRIRRLAERVWIAVGDSSDTWDAYARTRIARPRNGTVLAGPQATRRLNFAAPVHVLTAWNPESIRRSRDVNRDANRQLREVLVRHGTKPAMVIGESPDGRWREESYLVSGLDRAVALAIGSLFGQVAIFEITNEALIVLRCSDGEAMRTVPRVR